MSLRLPKVLILLTSMISCAYCQERAVLSGSPSGDETIQYTSATTDAGELAGLIGGPYVPPTFALSLMNLVIQRPQAQTGSSSIFDKWVFSARLQNTGRGVVLVPLQQHDVQKLLSLCPHAKMRHLHLNLVQDGTSSERQLTPLELVSYGCSAVPGSLIALAPGEWVSLRGTILRPVLSTKADLSLTAYLREEMYSHDANGVHVDMLSEVKIKPAPIEQ